MEGLQNLLKNTQIQTILKTQKIIFLDSLDTIEYAISKLSQNKILSAPVFKNGEYNGLVDYIDIMTYLLSVYPSEEDLEEDYFRVISFSGFELSKNNLHEIINLSKNNPSIPIFKKTSLLSDVCDIFGQGLHRVPLLKENDKYEVENILTQSNLINFIHSHIKEFPKLAKMTIRELEIENKDVVNFIEEKTPTIKVLHILFTKKVPSVIIVDEKKNPVANFSVSDLRGLDSTSFVDLTLPIKWYGDFFLKNILFSSKNNLFDLLAFWMTEKF
eukprot:TRINITY_DN1815_c0_g1_i1.p1 TRINITY_DN1815_c0_g1~~TRINITY_DN1815_c0_g1_i1.p1  ORF type:complete len:283 (+),score=65.72 TRINITY_DN1815_c0_g1_i1:34-849(+)